MNSDLSKEYELENIQLLNEIESIVNLVNDRFYKEDVKSRGRIDKSPEVIQLAIQIQRNRIFKQGLIGMRNNPQDLTLLESIECEFREFFQPVLEALYDYQEKHL